MANMDEFFNFDEAAHEPIIASQDNIDFNHLSNVGPYDIGLAFAHPGDDENAFTCLQHFSATDTNGEFDGFAAVDTSMMDAYDIQDFPRWIEGMNVPTQPCQSCRRMKIHCKVIREGQLKGSCTSCVALQRKCSFVAPGQCGKRKSFTESLREGVYDDQNNCVPSNEPTNPESYFASSFYSINEDNTHLRSLHQLAEKSSAQHVSHGSEDNLAALNEDNNPKIGARFSRDSVRILRGWLTTHYRHPYPTDEEKEALKRQTGLNKTQITNWLANARRRGKVRAPRSTSPAPNFHANAMDIPKRPATPGMAQMTPLDRWKHSPPENEPASISAISKAVTSSTFSSGRDSPYHSYGDDGSSRSLHNESSASSLGTSHSSTGSFASAYSYKSRGSYGSLGSLGDRGRRRRRRAAPKPVKVPTIAQPVRTFQCTFCTETFKTKHDWQRHEKSLHLSLERWVCCPNGPTQFDPATYENKCVFCGLANPPASHAEQHNYLSCADRNLEERSFYRKDHLRQHLNLVHDVKFQAFSMDTWKVSAPAIRSRCGFCGIILDSWTTRTDHLAEHFKSGKTMADWKGDWGFESSVLENVENGMPPYLIHDERNSMDPYSATRETTQDKTLEDWIKIGLVDYVFNKTTHGHTLTDDDLLLEARKIIHRAEERSTLKHPEVSWFRDLFMLSGSYPELLETQNVQMSWARRIENITNQAAQNHDLDAITCSKHRSLIVYVNNRKALGLTPTIAELQVEACRILDELEIHAGYKSTAALNWFKYLVMASNDWLEEFRKNVGIPRSSELQHESIRSTDGLSIDYSIHNGARLEKELIDYLNERRAVGEIPTDDDLQRQARLIIYECDDAWNQTLADDPEHLLLFKRQNGLAPPLDNFTGLTAEQINVNSGLVFRRQGAVDTLSNFHWDLDDGKPQTSPNASQGVAQGSGSGGWTTPENLEQQCPGAGSTLNDTTSQPLKYFLNDAQCYGRLLRELTRFVKTTMSPNNPNQHIPTDAEIQHSARVIIFDDDDPWNQTAADNQEWLLRFKRDVGLVSEDGGPGLLLSHNGPWQYQHGGTGFSPPYIHPRELPTEFKDDVQVQMDDREYDVKAKTATAFLKSMGMRYKKPAVVFCSRELESGLNDFVKEIMDVGLFPTDDMIRAKAREIMKTDVTPADDPVLLAKFKALHAPSTPLSDEELLAEFDKELERVNFAETGITPFSSGLNTVSAPATTTGTSPVNVNATMEGTNDLSRSKWTNQDYADLYRVSAATSSPLRRRASVKLASQHGFENPLTQQAHVIDTGVPLPVVQREKVQRLNGSGEIGVGEWQRWSQIVESNENVGMGGML